MKIIRPIAEADLDGLLHLAQTAGTGFTSLPPVRSVLQRKIERSLASFASSVQAPGLERYMFVLEDGERAELLGCCAIEAACGLDEPFYNYRVGLTVHASRRLQVYRRVPTLYLANDLTGAAVLCSLFLRRDARAAGLGQLLARSRFLFMAAHPQRFGSKVVAELRGISDEHGRSPFWDGLGRHFFSIDYDDAEHAVGRGNKAMIAELMPQHPIYTVLLPEDAQAALGQVHPETAPALRLLEREGFRYQGYVDIFDAGPAVEAPLAEIVSVKHSRLISAREGGAKGLPHLIATERLRDWRCVLGELDESTEAPRLDAGMLDALQLRSGELARVACL
ncbi:arginine N-succinyltransferase [Solimonas aquatica]|uniref:Arginine N-succinyltransferase n=1 Tax=Solimonas aquatica TaxID=489703 RepID=A0A1H9KG89_9GAMM|nr:arginine N-succinyltransferase [Solimonas aquatica]SEQ98108.1 arginine N-succinyltransferase [Solimonas aquatica]